MQTIRQMNALKVAIGSKYSGVPFDRPALRKMPAGWELEEAKAPWDWNVIGDRCVTAAIWAVGLWALVTIVWQYAK